MNMHTCAFVTDYSATVVFLAKVSVLPVAKPEAAPGFKL